MTKGITLQEIDTSATSRLVIKDSAGRAKVAEPSAADEIALKSTVDNAVGNLSTLQTIDKSNVVKAINELFTNVSNGKNSVAAAITGKGVAASGSDTFAVLAQKIGQISSGIKVASGNFSPNIDYRAPSGTISNLPFSPKILLLYGYAQVYRGAYPQIQVYSVGHLTAYNVGGSTIIGDYLSARLSEPERLESYLNILSATFGVNSVSFDLRIDGDYPFSSVTKYIVFGI